MVRHENCYGEERMNDFTRISKNKEWPPTKIVIKKGLRKVDIEWATKELSKFEVPIGTPIITTK